jgi:hypothetical protein
MHPGEIIKAPKTQAEVIAANEIDTCPLCGSVGHTCGLFAQWVDAHGFLTPDLPKRTHLRIFVSCSLYHPPGEATDASSRHSCTCSRQVLFSRGCQCGGL